MFSVPCIADDEPFEMTFVEDGEPDTWISVDGTILVRKQMLGWWHAYTMPDGKRIDGMTSYATKEEAARLACERVVR